MAYRPTLVNNQFNSPINLYSKENVVETMEKQKQILANGAVGIDFHQLAKPGNLANSAVLRMLEEEERNRKGKGLKRVAWPPPPEEQNAPVEENGFQEPIQSQGPVEYRPPEPPVKTQQSPLLQRRVLPRQGSSQERPPTPSFHPIYFEPPKTTVTLLPCAPVRQAPSPVFQSQPVAASVQGGNRMRGDQKWPPENVKQQSEAENAARIALAKGPTCRPRKVKKDYSTFFAQHALNSTYPGYRAPPGTQHYITEGTSNL